MHLTFNQSSPKSLKIQIYLKTTVYNNN